jgi:16S rRNA (cytosine1402-N4)-methyltransferase
MGFHESVLLRESIAALSIKPEGIYVDATFGGGGHSREILLQLGPKGKLFAFDQDEDTTTNRLTDERFTMINNNFRYLKNFLKFYKTNKVDGVMADLGISSYQIDTADRGFSTRFDGDLDMRMDKRNPVTAKKILNDSDEEKLTWIFRHYGEIKNASKLAKTIVSARKDAVINTTNAFKSIILSLAEHGKENKFLAQVFQSLRIEVNQEIEALQEFLCQSVEILNSGGRLVVISYHSLEDKPVKNFMRSGNFSGEIHKDFYGNPLVPMKVITRKPIVPGDEETARNNRARSARLRVAEKL